MKYAATFFDDDVLQFESQWNSEQGYAFDIESDTTLQGLAAGMTQLSFGDSECSGKRTRERTQRERFLAAMEHIVPWDRLLALIEPHYPKAARVDTRIRLPRCCAFI